MSKKGGAAPETAQSLAGLFAELQKCGHNQDWDKGLKVANRILQISPDESRALHCKLVCLIQQGNFKDALNMVNSSKMGPALAALHFEKAYIQYRLNLAEEALKTVNAAPELTQPLKELKAQILYRLENYKDCFEIYKDIVKNTSDEYEDERQSNVAAVYAYLSEVDNKVTQPWTSLGRHELMYNAACGETLKGKHAEAVKLLQKAETAATEFVNEDGGGEEELFEETAIIKVQLAYCLQMQGREKEAAELYQSILKRKPSDPALIAIASNNLVVMNKDANVFDSRKRMKAATQEGLEHKLTARQRKSILYNQALLSIYAGQAEHCKQLCLRLTKEFRMDKEANAIEASYMTKNGKHSQAINILSRIPDQHLATVQVMLTMGDRKGAIKLLEHPDLKYKPGVIGTLVTLYNADNNKEAISKLFSESMKHLKGSEAAASVEDAWRSKHGGPGGPANIKAIARLVTANCLTDLKQAIELTKKLPPIKDSGDKIDVDTLETSNWMMGAKVVKKSNLPLSKQEQSPSTPGTDKTKKKRNKKRKTKIPPHADLSAPPDPERWLPRYERSAYRKRRQRGNRGEVIKGSQGMTTSATDQYDMSKQTPSQGKSPRVVEKQINEKSEPGWQKNKQQKNKKRKGGKR